MATSSTEWKPLERTDPPHCCVGDPLKSIETAAASHVACRSHLNSKTHRSENRLVRRLLSSSLWAVVGRLASIASLILTFRMLCVVLSPTELSVFVIAGSIASIGTLVCYSGLSIVILRRISLMNAGIGSSPDSFGLLLRACGISSLVWVGFSTVFVCCHVAYPNFFGQSLDSIVGFTVLWTLARGVLLFFAEAARGIGRFGITAVLGGFQQGPIVNVVVLVVLFFGQDQIDTAAAALFVHLIVTIIIATFAGSVLAPGLVRSRDVKTAADYSGGKNNSAGEPMSNESGDTSGLVIEALKVTVSQLAIYGIIEFETLLVARSCEATEVGAWAATRRVMAVVSAPLLLVNASIPGFVSELYAQRDFHRLKKLLQISAGVATPIASLAAIGLFIFGSKILGFFDPSFAEFYLPLSILGAANIVFVGAGSGGMTLRMINRQGWASVTTVVIGIVYLIVAPPLIAMGGIIVAAILSALMIVFRNVIATLLVHHFLGFWCTPSYDRESRNLLRELLKKNLMKWSRK